MVEIRGHLLMKPWEKSSMMEGDLGTAQGTREGRGASGVWGMGQEGRVGALT